MTSGGSQQIVGWREWVSFPELGIPWIKAKLDTGARTSALHAHHLEMTTDDEGVTWAEFEVHPWQRSHAGAISCRAPLVDRRRVRSSTGHEAVRPVVTVAIELAGNRLDVEMTLTRRDSMGFRLLIGRQALRPGLLVDPGRSYLGGRPPAPIRRANRRQTDKQGEP